MPTSRRGVTRQLPDQIEHERTLARLRARLGQERLRALWAEGGRLSLDDVADHALQRPADREG